jgi:hypothetical protein
MRKIINLKVMDIYKKVIDIHKNHTILSILLIIGLDFSILHRDNKVILCTGISLIIFSILGTIYYKKRGY